MANKGWKKKKSKAKPKRIGAAIPRIASGHAFQRALKAFTVDEDLDTALTLLEQLDAQGPMSQDALRLYVEVLRELNETERVAGAATQLAERFPNDFGACLLAGSAALATMQPVSSILFLEHALKLAPQHELASELQGQVDRLRSKLPEILSQFIDHLPKELPRVASVERILHALRLGRVNEVISRCKDHLLKYPDDIRVRNNLAEALVNNSEPMQALEIINRTLEMAPDNFYALAARIRVCFFVGLEDECRVDSARLMTLEPKQISDLSKAAQAFAYIGDDTAVRWAYQSAKDRAWLGKIPMDTALLTFFYATSLARSGDVSAAKSMWNEVVKYGELSLVKSNLNDLKEPMEDQAGPAYFGIESWLSRAQVLDLQPIITIVDNCTDEPQTDRSLAQAARRFLSKYPQLERLIPAVLDRSDSFGQRLALYLATGSTNPVVKSALLNYVHGRRGTDRARLGLLIRLQREGQIFENPAPFYVKGKLHHIEIFQFEITYEATPLGLTGRAADLYHDGANALSNGEAAKAEKLFRQVLEINPDVPVVINNMAVAIEQQGRSKESLALVDDINARFPDYFFGNLAAAMRKCNAREYEEAMTILAKLMHKQRYHHTEFVGLARAMIASTVGLGQTHSARYWLSLVKQYVPDCPLLPEMEQAVNHHTSWTGAFKRLIELV